MLNVFPKLAGKSAHKSTSDLIIIIILSSIQPARQNNGL